MAGGEESMDQKDNTQLSKIKPNDIKSVSYAIWGIKPHKMQSIEHQYKRNKLKHGLFASAPLICRDEECPYVNVCEVDEFERQHGMRCPQEAALILTRFEQYCEHFDIDISGDEIDKKDHVDVNLIIDIVKLEVQIFRAENKTALNGDFIMDTFVNVVGKGNKQVDIYEKKVTPEVELVLRLSERKDRKLQLLNSTRKDKAAMAKNEQDASKQASNLFNKINNMINKDDIIEVVEVSDIEEPKSIEDIKDEIIPLIEEEEE